MLIDDLRNNIKISLKEKIETRNSIILYTRIY